MNSKRYRSWGLQPQQEQSAQIPFWAPEHLDLSAGKTVLPFGSGLSYGDSCLNADGEIIDVGNLNRFISFDANTGVLIAEPGVTINQIIQQFLPLGWFVPVSPGTSYVTLGGAIGNDVHGKNHHRDGTFGRFVKELLLLRSDGQCLRCNSHENSDMFRATIGGLGLTGVITRISLQLVRVSSAFLEVQMDTFKGMDEFCALSEKFRDEYQYTVAWLDCVSGGKQFSRGVFLAANHKPHGELKPGPESHSMSVPLDFPRWALNRVSSKMFNTCYFRWHSGVKAKRFTQHYQGFFYPLDTIGHWNRIYGSSGFYQYQFVVPFEQIEVLESILHDIVKSGLGSFLAVLKEFGELPSPGMLSFPRPGVCLALDFANRGVQTEQLILKLDDKVRAAGGAAYPAKDRLMRAESFEAYFERHDEFKRYVDPAFSSGFWRRVTQAA